MSWDGGGTFNRVHNFSADASAGIQAQAARFDAEFAEYKAGLENCLTITGETTPTADIPMGGFKLTGAGAATSSDQYITAIQQANQVGIYVVDTNGTTGGSASCSSAFFPTALSNGQRVTVDLSAYASVGPVPYVMTLKVNALSAPVIDALGSAVQGYQYQSTPVELIYSSVDAAWIILTPPDGWQTYSVGGRWKAKKANGTLAGTGSADFNAVYFKRYGNEIQMKTTNSVSVSVSVSASQLVYSAVNSLYWMPNNNGSPAVPVWAHNGSREMVLRPVVNNSASGFIFQSPYESFSGTACIIPPFTTGWNKTTVGG